MQLLMLVMVPSKGRHHICQTFYTSTFSRFRKFTPRKRVNRDILNLEYYIFGIFIHLIIIVSQFSYISAHFTHYQWVKFYPSDNSFTQVLLVTNIISGGHTFRGCWLLLILMMFHYKIMVS